MNYRLVCTRCGLHYGPANPIFRCKKCKSILEVEYLYPKRIVLKQGRANGLRYVQLLPLSKKVYSFGEGDTPLIRLKVKGTEILMKLETKNPTRSFKDRGSVVEISKAKELGFKQVCCASTGNMGLSVATYARKVGLKCAIFISKDARPEKIRKIKAQKAEIIEVDGDFNVALKTAELFARVNSAFLCGDYHYRKEGQKSVIYEIVEQCRGKVDFIALPVGNATLLAAAYKALSESRRFGMLKSLPRIIAVQAEGCDPLVRAFNKSGHVKYVSPRTIADAIAVGYPTFGFEGITALHKTKGITVSVKDAELLTAIKRLKEAGISAEPGGAAAFAGFLKLNRKEPKLFSDKVVACLVTGNN